MSLQMLKKAMIAYVANSAKAIWSKVAYPLDIAGKKSCDLADYRIYGNSVQDGEPTPENPIEIQSVGELQTEGEYAGKYKIPVVARGKNYFDLDKVPFNSSTTLPYNDGLTAKKKSGINRGSEIPISLPVGKTIYMTMDVVDSQISGTTKRVTMGFYNSKKTRVSATNVSSTVAHKSYSFTLSEEVSYIQFYFQSDNTANAVGDYVTIDNIMLRTEGDDSYEGYIEPKIVNIYLDEPLRKIGIYEDTIDFKKSVVVRKNFGKVFSGEEKWSKSNDDAYPNRFSFYMGGLKAAPNSNIIRWCSHYKHCTYNSLKHGYFACTNSLTLYIYDDRFTTVDELKAYLTEQAKLGTPLTTVLPDCRAYEGNPVEEKIELPPIPQFKGTTIYEVVTGVPPSGIEVCYYG